MKPAAQRKICIITGSRAEYGLLYPLIKKIDEDKELKLQLIATGMHLSPEFGLTYKAIENEFEIDKKIDINLSCEQEDIAKSMGIAQIKFAKALSRLKPDIIVILGDRYEIFAAAATATVLNIPIAHIHGGELTYGAIDDAFRHSITKMSHLHFTSTKEYRKRVIQLGENPKTVFYTGALGVENIKSLQLLSKKELEKKLGFKFGKKNIMITYHPQTISQLSPKEQIKKVLDALSCLNDVQLIFTKSNADFGGIEINTAIDKFVKSNDNTVVFTSLGQINYFSALKYVDCVVGNSSSGILEVPSFKIPTINIGDRQKGRIQAKSILNAKICSQSIQKALKLSYSESFRDKLNRIKNPYDRNFPSKQIIKTLKKVNLDKLIKKSFWDIPYEQI